MAVGTKRLAEVLPGVTMVLKTEPFGLQYVSVVVTVLLAAVPK
jgi:hypothetical protein